MRRGAFDVRLAGPEGMSTERVQPEEVSVKNKAPHAKQLQGNLTD